jgi:hypothetical protein
LSQDSAGAARPGLPAGFVWAALLFGVVVVIGSVALLLWVARATQAGP